MLHQRRSFRSVNVRPVLLPLTRPVVPQIERCSKQRVRMRVWPSRKTQSF